MMRRGLRLDGLGPEEDRRVEWISLFTAQVPTDAAINKLGRNGISLWRDGRCEAWGWRFGLL